MIIVKLRNTAKNFIFEQRINTSGTDKYTYKYTLAGTGAALTGNDFFVNGFEPTLF